MENEPPVQEKVYREPAIRMLEHQIERVEKHLDSLKTIKDLIPWNDLSKEEDEHLWSLFGFYIK